MEKHENFTYEGVTVLRVRISLPSQTGSEEIDRFLEQMGDRVYGFCSKRLLSYAKTNYENDPDPKRYLHFSPVAYYLTGTIRQRSDTKLLLQMDASLLQKGAPAKKFSDTLIFSLPDGLLCPPKRHPKNKTSAHWELAPDARDATLRRKGRKRMAQK